MPSSVLITGAGGGLGGVTTELFATRGWTVFAADLKPPTAAANIVTIALDVTSSESCAAAAKEIAEHVPGLDAVVNFAGVLEIGRPLVELPEDRMRLTLDVNVYGTYLINKTMFPLVLAGKGRILNISSEAGRNTAMALSAPYSVSKHAVEAYSDALRRELMFVGVPVVTIQPGPFRTNMTRSINHFFVAARNPESPFDRLIAKVGKAVSGRDDQARDPRELAEAVWQAATTPKPKARYAVRHTLRERLIDPLPTRVIDWLMKRALS